MTKDYNVEELERLLGCKITGVVIATDEEGFYGIKIDNPTMEEGYILWFMRDEEGNGPGSFVIENFDTAEDFEEV